MNVKPLNIVSFTVLILAVQPAYAYLDPGTGSIFLQGLLASVVAAAVTGKVYWEQLKGFFSRKDKSNELPEDEKDEDSE